MEYYSAIKNDKILAFAGKWMKVENIMLSEISQSRTLIQDKAGLKTAVGFQAVWLLEECCRAGLKI